MRERPPRPVAIDAGAAEDDRGSLPWLLGFCSLLAGFIGLGGFYLWHDLARAVLLRWELLP